jgi:hypothetical protein
MQLPQKAFAENKQRTMRNRELNLQHTMYRFDLKVNSYSNAFDNAFSWYGIFIIPTLVSGVLMYNMFHLRDEYFVIAYAFLIILLLNIHFFYKKINIDNQQLKLIINNGYVQLIDNNQIHFQGSIENLQTEVLLCGKELKPALKISTEGFDGLIIGLENSTIDYSITRQNKLWQPDYWLKKTSQANILIDLITKEDYTSVLKEI